MFTLTCQSIDLNIVFFCSYYKVTYRDVVGKYSYVVCASIGKLSFSDSCVISQSNIFKCKMYYVTCETLQALQ